MPFTTQIALKIRDTFIFMNTFGCSYFIISVIGFYNITLLYYFLHVPSLPSFARMFIYSVAYIFFQRGSIIDTLNKID